jgi:hypothetical protein
MRGLKTNAYLNTFVMVGRDILDDANQATINTMTSTEHGSCVAATPDFTTLDTSDVSLHTIEQCKLVGGIERAAHALHVTSAMRVPTATLSCPHCNFPHLDTPATCHN